MKTSKKNPNFSRRKKSTFADGGGVRFNKDKTRIELVPVEWVWGLADVTTRGTVEGGGQYPARNWERGMKWAIPVGCALRHFFKFCCGERYDPETGCHHMFMAAWNCCVLATYDLNDIGENNLPLRDMSILARVNSGMGTNYAETATTGSRKRRSR